MFEPEHSIDRGCLERIGIQGIAFKQVAWTPELILREHDAYASTVEGSVAEFRVDVQNVIDKRVDALLRTVKQPEAEHAAVIRRAETGRSRAADAALLPRDQIAERLMEYERHLYGQLTSTFHELERVQDRRGLGR